MYCVLMTNDQIQQHFRQLFYSTSDSITALFGNQYAVFTGLSVLKENDPKYITLVESMRKWEMAEQLIRDTIPLIIWQRCKGWNAFSDFICQWSNMIMVSERIKDLKWWYSTVFQAGNNVDRLRKFIILLSWVNSKRNFRLLCAARQLSN